LVFQDDSAQFPAYKEWQAKHDSCQNETAKFCPNEESRCAIRRCLIANVDQLTGTCAAYIQEKIAKKAKEASACDNDAKILCSNSTSFSSTLLCMKTNSEKLSQECRRFFYRLKKSHHGKKDDEEDHHGKKDDEEDHHHERKTHRRESHSKRKGEPKSDKRGDKKTRKHEKRSMRRSEKCVRKLKVSCDKDITTFCASSQGFRPIKTCLTTNFNVLEKACQQSLLSSKWRDYDTEASTEAVVSDSSS